MILFHRSQSASTVSGPYSTAGADQNLWLLDAASVPLVSTSIAIFFFLLLKSQFRHRSRWRCHRIWRCHLIWRLISIIENPLQMVSGTVNDPPSLLFSCHTNTDVVLCPSTVKLQSCYYRLLLPGDLAFTRVSISHLFFFFFFLVYK